MILDERFFRDILDPDTFRRFMSYCGSLAEERGPTTTIPEVYAEALNLIINSYFADVVLQLPNPKEQVVVDTSLPFRSGIVF